jgi:ATP-dependent DNA helicase RecG
MSNRHHALIEEILGIPAENQTIEFKRVDGSKNSVGKIVESVVAMTNTEGGVLVLGVEDPEKTKLKGLKRVLGIEENIENFDAIGREVRRIIPPLGSIWPPDKLEVSEIGKHIALLHVPKSTDCFRSIDNHVWVRLEKGIKQLTPQEVIRFSYAKGFEKADRELVDVDFRLLESRQYQDWKAKRSVSGSKIREVLEKTGLAKKNKSGKLLPTRAAVLLFADYPSELMDTKAAVRIFQYTGNIETIGETPNYIGTPKTIGGPIVEQIKKAHEYVLTLLRSGVRIPSGFLTEYQIPERAVKEAITNAIIHRDYYLKRDVEIKIFEDRVEIQSPGLLPYNITAANIGLVRADSWRNDLLVKHLREFPAPPNLDQNEGVRAMRSEMKAQNLYPPIFWTYPNLQDSVRVILFNEKIATEWQKVSKYLDKNKYITNEKARFVTGIVQRDKMSQMLKNWVRQGLLLQIVPSSGYVRATKYRLTSGRDINKT